MRTRAERRGDGYVLNGQKMFVTNAPVADLIVVYATIDPALGATGVTAFIVESRTPGVLVGRKLHKMGLRTSPMAEVIFEDCYVPASNRLGREGRGVQVFESSMEWSVAASLQVALASCAGNWRTASHSSGAATVRKTHRKVPGRGESARGHEGEAGYLRPLVYRIGWMKIVTARRFWKPHWRSCTSLIAS